MASDAIDRSAGPSFAQLVGGKPDIVSRLKLLNVHQPNAVQQQAIPLIRGGKDVVLHAPTGCGKTVAFLLPLLEHVNPRRAETQVLILTPTRELAVQVTNVLRVLTDLGRPNRKGNAIRVLKLVGSGVGHSFSYSQNVLKAGPHVIVATPQVMNRLVKEKQFNMYQVRHVVLDEVDHMLAFEDSARRLNRILKPSRRRQEVQFIMSSATSPDLSELRSLPWLHGRSPEVVRTEQESRVPPVIQHKYLLCASAEERMQKLLELFKHRVLYNGVLQHKAAALVFVNSGSTAMTVANALLERHMRVGVVAGADLTLGVRDSKKARHDAVRGLVKRQLQAIVCTDILARGMDFQGLTHVVNFDMPSTPTAYVHRAGRVGRHVGTPATVVSCVDGEGGLGTLRSWGEELGFEPLECVEQSVL